ncbi:MAG: N-(5'-phosphoribosyl)anthranilate isomerase [Rhizobiales bacterium 17-65-6]|nr:MAG: N-(5'-phosphoribosyl)anthranilate isomerase [Rhizobiales bacterium 17-65-6]
MSLDIKICGVNTPEALEAALAARADMVGFVSFARSPRHLSPAAMAALGAQVAGRARKVLLTVDASDAELEALVAALRPDLLQLHGEESPERVAQVRARFGVPVMKAISIRTAQDLAAVPAYAAVSDRLLFDAKPQPGAVLPGGNGIVFDWSLLRGLDPGRPVMLSGGLDPTNVAQAIASVPLDGVDVSSGVESAPGVKAPEKIAAFVEAARAARLS